VLIRQTPKPRVRSLKPVRIDAVEGEMIRPSTVVLTISRELGSGGSFIGQAVARRLGLKYVDREILQEAARLLDAEDHDLERLEERVSTFWTRTAQVFSLGGPDVTYVPPTLRAVYEEDLFKVESRIIQEIATRDSAVIVGRGGFHVLRDHPGLVSVFVHAPEAWRAERIMATHGAPDLASAFEILRRSDRDRAKFILTMTGLPWQDAHRSHLCLDTSKLGLDTAVDLVAHLVSSRLGRS
jgi:cytidylate kinase